jgi:hypothetical protein
VEDFLNDNEDQHVANQQSMDTLAEFEVSPVHPGRMLQKVPFARQSMVLVGKQQRKVHQWCCGIIVWSWKGMFDCTLPWTSLNWKDKSLKQCSQGKWPMFLHLLNAVGVTVLDEVEEEPKETQS